MNWKALDKQTILKLQQTRYRSSISESNVLDIFNYIFSVHFMQKNIRCSCTHTTRKVEHIMESVDTMITFLTIFAYHLGLVFQKKPRPIYDTSQDLFKHGFEIELNDESISLRTKWEYIQNALELTKNVFQNKHLELIISGITDFTERRSGGNLIWRKLPSTRNAVEHSMLTANERNNIPKTLPVPYDDRFVNFFNNNGQEEAETFIEFAFKVNFSKDGKRYGTINDLIRLEKDSYTSLLQLSDELKHKFGPLRTL